MTAQESQVFIVDDDPSVRDALGRLMRSAGLEARSFDSAEAFLAIARPDMPSCVILDVRMPGPSGLDLQSELRARGDFIPVIFITGHGTIPVTVRAMKAGALDFLTKPFDDQELLDAVSRALEANNRARQIHARLDVIEKRVATLRDFRRHAGVLRSYFRALLGGADLLYRRRGSRRLCLPRGTGRTPLIDADSSFSRLAFRPWPGGGPGRRITSH